MHDIPLTPQHTSPMWTAPRNSWSAGASTKSHYCCDVHHVAQLYLAVTSHPRPFSVEALVYRGCPAGTHKCDQVSPK